MSWLLIIILIITLLSVLAGIRKGLIRTIVSTFFLVFVMLLSTWLTPYARQALEDYTQVESYVETKCDAFITNALTASQNNHQKTAGTENVSDAENADAGDGISQIENQEDLRAFADTLGLPAFWTEKLMQASTKENFQASLQESAALYAKEYLSQAIMNIISFLLAFAISIFFIWLVLRVVDVVTELPFISFANRLGGGIAGLVRSILWVWVFFSVLAIFGETQWGASCMNEIKQDQILSFLYSNNLLLDIILRML